jgi:hypothetical protein
MNLFNSSGKRARIAGTVLLLVVFVAGALAGAASERVMRADEVPGEPRKTGTEMRGGSRRLLQDEQFAKELQLTSCSPRRRRRSWTPRARRTRRSWCR